MATLVTHAFVPLALGRTVTEEKMGARFWVLAIFCSVLPDADVIGFSLGVEYGDFFGHRGFFHSIFFAFILSLLVAVLAFRKAGLFSKKWRLIWVFLFVVSASHGVLDAFTDGGLGIALFSPFDAARYFFPWRPLRVSPIGIDAFFRYGGAEALVSDIVWVWLPLLGALFGAERLRAMRRKAKGKGHQGRRRA